MHLAEADQYIWPIACPVATSTQHSQFSFMISRIVGRYILQNARSKKARHSLLSKEDVAVYNTNKILV